MEVALLSGRHDCDPPDLPADPEIREIRLSMLKAIDESGEWLRRWLTVAFVVQTGVLTLVLKLIAGH
jgi:hypothetical protein